MIGLAMIRGYRFAARGAVPSRRRAVALSRCRRFAVPMLAHHLASSSLALQGMFFLPLGVGSGSIGGNGVCLVGRVFLCGLGG